MRQNVAFGKEKFMFRGKVVVIGAGAVGSTTAYTLLLGGLFQEIVLIDINKEKDPSYRYLLQAESREVNRQKNRIKKNAEIVYSHKKHNGNETPLAKRTNDFELLEKLCKEY